MNSTSKTQHFQTSYEQTASTELKTGTHVQQRLATCTTVMLKYNY